MSEAARRQPLTLGSRVIPNRDVLFQELQGEGVLLNLTSGVYFGLDSVGMRIWQLIGQHERLDEVARGIASEFDVSEARCVEDLLSLVEQLREHDLVQVEA